MTRLEQVHSFRLVRVRDSVRDIGLGFDSVSQDIRINSRNSNGPFNPSSEAAAGTAPELVVTPG